MGTVVVLGSLITNVVARAPRMPQPGEALFGEDFATFLGGKGINQAIAAACLGAQVTLIGRLGSWPCRWAAATYCITTDNCSGSNYCNTHGSNSRTADCL